MKTNPSQHDYLQSFKQFAEVHMHNLNRRCTIGSYAILINKKAAELIRQALISDPAIASSLEREILMHGKSCVKAFAKHCKN